MWRLAALLNIDALRFNTVVRVRERNQNIALKPFLVSDQKKLERSFQWGFQVPLWIGGKIGLVIGVDLDLIGTARQSFEGTFCTSKDLGEVRIY